MARTTAMFNAMFDGMMYWGLPTPPERAVTRAPEPQPVKVFHWPGFAWPMRVPPMPEGWRRRPFDWAKDRWEW